MRVTREQIIKAIWAAKRQLHVERLPFRRFHECSGISKRQVLNHFDRWSDACKAAETLCGPTRENLVPRRAYSKQECVEELRRAADKLRQNYLSMPEFGKHGKMHPETVRRKFDNRWENALRAAGLRPHPSFHKEVGLSTLSQDFVNTAEELRRIPTLNQVARRSRHGKYCFSDKFTGYPTFKRLAIEHVLSSGQPIPASVSAMLEEERKKLGSQLSGDIVLRPPEYEHGRILGFHAFAYRPTYEQEVVSIFSSVADELGFEILCLREAFPDCEARRRKRASRKRYDKCLIEFELRSLDYKHHKHPMHGCNLIVCWEHNWAECPFDVLELKTEIKKLQGWH